jgi:hypothetical protein
MKSDRICSTDMTAKLSLEFGVFTKRSIKGTGNSVDGCDGCDGLDIYVSSTRLRDENSRSPPSRGVLP